MIKKQTITVIIIALAIIALALAYVFVISPMLEASQSESGSDEEIQELIEGEIRDVSDRILIFEHISKADIQSVEVVNEHGGYTMHRGSDGEFYLLGYENAPYSLEMLSNLVVSAGYPLAMTRITEDCPDLSEYGLADADSPAYYVLTKTDGTQHKLFIGDMIPTGAGYYVRYSERNAVYVLDSTIAVTLLAPVTALVTPIVAYPVGSNDYYLVDDFYIVKDDEVAVYIDYLTEEEKEQTASTSVYRMLAPAQYVVNISSYADLLYALISMQGEEVVYMGGADTEISEEVLGSYGIDTENIELMLHYTYSGVESFVAFSQPDEDGKCYAFSMLFNMIVRMDVSTVNFLWWDIIKYVDRMTYSLYLNDVASITLESPEFSETFIIEGTDQEITVFAKNASKNIEDVTNFRQFYKTILSVYLEDYAENTDTESLECMLTMTVVTDAGIEYEYKYYPYSTRRCFYTINGEGLYYVYIDDVEKIISDAQKVIQGIAVDSYAKN